MKWILLSLSLTALLVLGNGQGIPFIGELLGLKSSWVNQVEQQVGTTRSVVSSGRISEFGKHVADIGEAIQFAHDEVDRLSTLLMDLDEECEANLPATPQSIRTSANDFMAKCVDLALNTAGEDVEEKYFEAIEGYRTTAMDWNFIFSRDLFKTPMYLYSLSFVVEMANMADAMAIRWDNVDSMDLYNLRAESKAALEPIGPALYSCIMDFKEFIATEYGRVFLYLWEC